MKIVFKITNDRRAEVENLIRTDEVINRQSITIRAAESLGISGLENCYIMIIEGSEQSIERAKDLLKEKAEIVQESQKILDKIKEEEDNAVCGFGSIFG